MRHAELVHSGIPKLACEGKHQRPRAPVVGPYLEQNGHVSVLGLEILILSEQGLAVRGGLSPERERRAPAFPMLRSLRSRLAEHGFFHRDSRSMCKAADLVKEIRAQGLDAWQKADGIGAEFVAGETSELLDP